MRSAKRWWAVPLLPFVVAVAVANNPQSTSTPQTLEEAAGKSCVWKGSSVRELVEKSRKTGFSTDTIEALEFAVCIGKEKEVLEEEVRRGYRASFAPGKARQQTQQTGEMPCPPSHWMTSDGCQKVLTSGLLPR